MRRVVTEDVVVRRRPSSLSSKAITLYTAHLTSCRYAGSADATMANVVEVQGHDQIRSKIAVGIVQPCKVCKPTLLIESGEE